MSALWLLMLAFFGGAYQDTACRVGTTDYPAVTAAPVQAVDRALYPVQSADEKLGLAIVTGAFGAESSASRSGNATSIYALDDASTEHYLQFYLQETEASGPLAYPLRIEVQTYAGLYLGEPTATAPVLIEGVTACNTPYVYRVPIGLLPDLPYEGRYTATVEVFDNTGSVIGMEQVYVGHGPYFFEEPLPLESRSAFAVTGSVFRQYESSPVIKLWVENLADEPTLRRFDMAVVTRDPQRLTLPNGVYNELALGPNEAVLVDVPYTTANPGRNTQLTVIIQDMLREDIRLEDTLQLDLRDR